MIVGQQIDDDANGDTKRPLVSVLIPCFNAERFVGAALEAVLAQTYAPIEVIVVDDGSTDGSAGVVAGFADRGVVLNKHKCGSASAARNRAFASSHGNFALFLDADDLIAPDHVAALAGRLDPAIQAVAMGQWDRFTIDPTEARFPDRPGYHDAKGIDWLCLDWRDGQPMTQCGTFLIPRSLIDAVGGWDERLGLIDDFEFFARVLCAAEELVFAPDARLYYRSVPGSLSAQASPEAAASAALSLALGTDHLLAAENSPRTRRAAANMLQTFDYTFYPAYAELRRDLAERIAELGGSDLPPIGPPGFHTLRRWIGWRAARRVQRMATKLGLNRTGRPSEQDRNRT